MHIEAIIAEVNSNKMSELGIQWQFNNGSNGLEGGSSFSIDGNNTAINNLTKPMQSGSGLSVGYFVGGNLLSMLRALEQKGDSNILAIPSITVVPLILRDEILDRSKPGEIKHNWLILSRFFCSRTA